MQSQKQTQPKRHCEQKHETDQTTPMTHKHQAARKQVTKPKGPSMLANLLSNVIRVADVIILESIPEALQSCN